MAHRLRIVLLAVCLFGISGGCTNLSAAPVQSATPTPAPTFAPSPACGGFHLTVHNTGSAAVLVRVNSREMAPVDGGATRDIAEWGAPSAGALPWTVEIVDPATGKVIATRELSESSGSGAATLEVKAVAGAAPTVGDVQSAKGC